MKKIKVLILGLLVALIFSCSKDGNTDEVASNDDEINQLEETVLEETLVLNNLKIDGATKKTGTPSPTGGISFELENTSNSAFLKSGFSIDFKDTSDEFVGAYLQIKSIDGNVADGYWDISNISSKNALIKKFERNAKQSLFSKSKLTGGSITVNFLDAIKPGKFCYVICVYNSSGDISNPIEVCVEVENWGGNSNFVGSWEIVSEEYIENGVSEGVINVGEDACDDDYFYCTTTQAQITYEYCYKIISSDFRLNNDGTYYLRIDQSSSDIDYQASQQNCVAVGVYENYYYITEGKWAYDEEENILTLIEFFYDEDGDTGTEPDGYVMYQGPAFLNNNILTITDTYIDGSYAEEWILKFSKK